MCSTANIQTHEKKNRVAAIDTQFIKKSADRAVKKSGEHVASNVYMRSVTSKRSRSTKRKNERSKTFHLQIKWIASFTKSFVQIIYKYVIENANDERSHAFIHLFDFAIYRTQFHLWSIDTEPNDLRIMQIPTIINGRMHRGKSMYSNIQMIIILQFVFGMCSKAVWSVPSVAFSNRCNARDFNDFEITIAPNQLKCIIRN